MRKPIQIAFALCGLFFAAQIAGAADSAAIWTSKIQPLVDANCVKCHGPMQQKSGLELDTIEMLAKGGDDGAVIVPGKPQQSRLYNNLDPNAEQHMPPKKQLSEPDRKMVRDWIASMTAIPVPPPAKPHPLRHFESVTQAVDALISEGWKQRHVKPAPAVDDRSWCRRAYLDLAGRICTPVELKAFLESHSSSKRADLVDHLLSSDEYPVHMREVWDVLLMGRPKRERTEDRRRDNGWWNF